MNDVSLKFTPLRPFLDTLAAFLRQSSEFYDLRTQTLSATILSSHQVARVSCLEGR